MRSISRNIVSAVILSKDNKILLGKKDPEKGGVYSDCWHIPGGGIYPNETKEEGLIREVREEVGIDITKHEVSLLDDKGTGESKKTPKDKGEEVLCKMKFFVYLVKVDKESSYINVSLNDDLVEYIWINKDRIDEFKLTPPSGELFTRLGWIK